MSIDPAWMRFGGAVLSKRNSRKEQSTGKSLLLKWHKAKPPVYVVPPSYEPGQPPSFENCDGDTLLLSGQRNANDVQDAYEQWIERQQALFTDRFPEVATLDQDAKEERFIQFLEETQGSTGMTSDLELDPHRLTRTRPRLRRDSEVAVRLYLPIERVERATENNSRQQALVTAIRANDPDQLEELMRNEGVNVNARYEQQGITPMHMAALRGNPEMIQRLARYGADVNGTTESGTTPLHLAAQIEQTAAVRMLLRLGADPALRDRHDRSALYFATVRDNRECMAALFGIPERF